MSKVEQKCNCTMAKSLTGDGCRYCQPQEYIDRLHELIEEETKDAERYRWLRDDCEYKNSWILESPGDIWDDAIDEAMREDDK